jgi:hypothetical protein
MTKLAICLAAAAAALPVQSAFACPPPPPGYVEPTPAQRLAKFANDSTDIVYGVVTRTAAPGAPVGFEILHVYKGDATKGAVVDGITTYDYPQPFCAAMMAVPPSKPVGAYGVAVMRHNPTELVFFSPDDAQAMIAAGLIRSARAR